MPSVELFPPWRDQAGSVEVAFFGRGFDDPFLALSFIGEARLRVASLRQVHSPRVLEADPRRIEDGDGLVCSRPDVALLVVTADCVPVLLGGDDRVAALHAGWRGLAAGILEEGVRCHAAPPLHQTAWIGPAIGPCCYEVSEEVACAVAGDDVAQLTTIGLRNRPLLDLPSVVEHRLRRCGVEDIRIVRTCTRCFKGLHSYRRDGSGGGRNLAFVWRRSARAPWSAEVQTC